MMQRKKWLWPLTYFPEIFEEVEDVADYARSMYAHGAFRPCLVFLNEGLADPVERQMREAEEIAERIRKRDAMTWRGWHKSKSPEWQARCANEAEEEFMPRSWRVTKFSSLPKGWRELPPLSGAPAKAIRTQPPETTSHWVHEDANEPQSRRTQLDPGAALRIQAIFDKAKVERERAHAPH